MSGLPGAGKTTLLGRASAGAGFTVISRDLIRAAMFPGPRPHTGAETDAAFEAMIAAAGRRLGAGGRVALDGCCFGHRRQRDRAAELAAKTGATLVGVHLDLPAAEAVRRVAEHGEHPARDRDAALVARVARTFAPPEADDLVIDATRTAAEVWAALSGRLRALGATAGGVKPPG